MKRYKSLKEMNKDLKLLKLQTEIYEQQASIDFIYLKKGLTITNLLTELLSNIGTSFFFKKLGAKLYEKLGIRLDKITR